MLLYLILFTTLPASALEAKSGIFTYEGCNEDSSCTFVSTDDEWISGDFSCFDMETLRYGYVYISYEQNSHGECQIIDVIPLTYETGYLKRIRDGQCIIDIGKQEIPFICSREIGEAAAAQTGELAFWYYPQEHENILGILEPQGMAGYERFYFYSAYEYQGINYCRLERYNADVGVAIQCSDEQIDFITANKYKLFRLVIDGDRLVRATIDGDLPQGVALLKKVEESYSFFEMEGVALDRIAYSEKPLGSHAGIRLETGKTYFIIYTYGFVSGGVNYLLYAKEITD